jgi:hypothetical protein
MADSNYKMLNRARFESQELLRVLYEKHDGNADRSAFQLLVAAGLCLWRSAFMIDQTLQFKQSGKDAVRILERLLDDNMLAFSSEMMSRNWMAAFYLNSAEFRIVAAGRRLEVEPNEHGPFASVHRQVGEYLSRVAADERAEEDVADRWMTTLRAAQWLALEKL